MVDRINQRLHFSRHRTRRNRSQISRTALANPPDQTRQRTQSARQAKPDQHRRNRQNDELRQDHALHDFVSHLRALVERFGHLHQCRTHRRTSFCRSLSCSGCRRCPCAAACRCCTRHRRHRKLHPSVSNAHLDALHLVIAEQHTPGHRHFVLARQRQITVTRDILAALPGHLKVDRTGIVGAQDVAGRQRQISHHPPPAHLDLLGQHQDAVRQRVVKRRVRERLGGGKCEQHRHRHQQHHRHPEPVENFAKQRTVGMRIIRHEASQPVPAPARKRRARMAGKLAAEKLRVRLCVRLPVRLAGKLCRCATGKL